MSENKEILYGCAYYLEYMPTKDAVAHMTMMKEAGMNVVRIAESTWSTLEPQPGIFSFDHIDAMLEAAQTVGMKVIIGTPTYAIPSWMVRLHPDVNVPRKDGRAAYGHRQDMDITNPDYLFYAKRVIRELIHHVAAHPNVIGFQVDNETKHYGTYSEYAQRGFKKYMQKKFVTVENLNNAYHLEYWSNSISDWDDFPDMRGCVNAGLSSAYEAYLRRQAAMFLKMQADIVREYAREDQFITHNLDFEWKKFGANIAQDGYSYGIQPDINHDQVAEFLDIAGTDIYHPTQDELTGAEIAFGGDEIRSLKNDNYLVLESQAQAFKYWTPFPGQLRLHAYSHIASGAEGVMYWNWQSIHNGYETYWRGVLSHDLVPNETYRDCCEIGRELQRLGREAIIKKNNLTAILVDNRSLTSFKWFPIDKDLSYNDVVRWMYDSLYEMNIECDIVHAEKLDVSKYKVIIIPAMYSASDELIAELRYFVANGGILIGSFKSFVADRNLTVYDDAQPHGMTDVFGITYQSFTIPGTAKLMPVGAWLKSGYCINAGDCINAGNDIKAGECINAGNGIKAGECINAGNGIKTEECINAGNGIKAGECINTGKDYKNIEYFMELLTKAGSKPTIKGQFEPEVCGETELLACYDHQYWGRFGAISEHSFGNGRAYYVGAYITKEALKALYAYVYQKAGIAYPKANWPLTVRSGINEAGKKLHYVFNYTSQPVSVSLTDVIPGAVGNNSVAGSLYEGQIQTADEGNTEASAYSKQYTDLLTGLEYKMTEAEADSLELKDWGVIILEEQ
jgi:beta-galactosidase